MKFKEPTVNIWRKISAISALMFHAFIYNTCTWRLKNQAKVLLVFVYGTVESI